MLSVKSCQAKCYESFVLCFRLQACKSLIGTQSDVVESIESRDLKRVLYDLCLLAINGSLKVDQVSTTLIELAVSAF